MSSNLAAHSPTLVSLNVLKDLRGLPVETLDAPMPTAAVKQELERLGIPATPSILNKKLAADGIHLKGIDPRSAALPVFLTDIGRALHTVKDEHMPAMSVVQCGFVRTLSLEQTPQGETNLRIYMRFTVDECPAGKRLTQKVTEAIQAIPTQGKAMKAGTVEVIHGGSDWKPVDADERVQAILKTLMGCSSSNLVAPPRAS